MRFVYNEQKNQITDRKSIRYLRKKMEKHRNIFPDSYSLMVVTSQEVQ